jgi:uncharacterized protein YbgA (DUF1722 family)/uncharacterized protein YbbK (DUF523 family)
MSKIRLGISTCLLGEKVRYDGQHKLDRYLRDTLGAFVEYVPVCPEYEAGFGIPREAMRLVGDANAPRLYTIRTKQDVTEKMQSWIKKRLPQLDEEHLDGFIFKSKSPSSGMERVKLYPSQEGGMPKKNGIGLFARAFMDRYPLLPVEEEGRLHDANLRENFIERIFTLHRWRACCESGPTKAALTVFHAQHKLLLMAHAPAVYRELGTALGTQKGRLSKVFIEDYIRRLMTALARTATPARHVNVMQHILGYFKNQLSPDEKQECLALIRDYRSGYTPLIVPLTLLNHFVRKYGQEYLAQQVYLHPHPVELALRNHV